MWTFIVFRFKTPEEIKKTHPGLHPQYMKTAIEMIKGDYALDPEAWRKFVRARIRSGHKALWKGEERPYIPGDYEVLRIPQMRRMRVGRVD